MSIEDPHLIGLLEKSARGDHRQQGTGNTAVDLVEMGVQGADAVVYLAGQGARRVGRAAGEAAQKGLTQVVYGAIALGERYEHFREGGSSHYEPPVVSVHTPGKRPR